MELHLIKLVGLCEVFFFFKRKVEISVSQIDHGFSCINKNHEILHNSEFGEFQVFFFKTPATEIQSHDQPDKS